jgi:hypothetical protein
MSTASSVSPDHAGTARLYNAVDGPSTRADTGDEVDVRASTANAASSSTCPGQLPPAR